MTYYETVSASGAYAGGAPCGHRHRTWEAADRCRQRELRRVRLLPGGNSYADLLIRRRGDETLDQEGSED